MDDFGHRRAEIAVKPSQAIGPVQSRRPAIVTPYAAETFVADDMTRTGSIRAMPDESSPNTTTMSKSTATPSEAIEPVDGAELEPLRFVEN